MLDEKWWRDAGGGWWYTSYVWSVEIPSNIISWNGLAAQLKAETSRLHTDIATWHYAALVQSQACLQSAVGDSRIIVVDQFGDPNNTIES